jgi:hypothetical protein
MQDVDASEVVMDGNLVSESTWREARGTGRKHTGGGTAERHAAAAQRGCRAGPKAADGLTAAARILPLLAAAGHRPRLAGAPKVAGGIH